MFSFWSQVFAENCRYADLGRVCPATSISVVQDSTHTSTVTTAVPGGFNTAIALSASGQPSGVTVSYTPTSFPAPGSGTATMQVTASTASTIGHFVITITGTGGGKTNTTTVDLTIMP